MAGFFRKAGQFLGNYGKATADVFTGGKAIKENAYKGAGSNFFRKASRIGGNITTGIADTTLGSLGLGNILTENAYTGDNADKWNKGFDIGGKVGGVALQVGGNILAPGIGGQVVSQLQEVGEGINPQDEMYENYNQTNYNNFDYGNTYALGRPMQGYAEGGVVGSSSGNLNPLIAGGTAALGLLQAIQGYRGLKKIQKEPIPELTITPQLRGAYDRAQLMTTRGYTPQQEAAFKALLASQQNTAFRNALNQGGGNLAQAINAGLKSQNIDALNQFAANDSEIQRQNIKYADSFADRFQGVSDENIRAALQRRMARETALGQATQSGLNNLANAANMFGAYGYEGLMKNKNQKRLNNISRAKTINDTAFSLGPLSELEQTTLPTIG